MAHAKTSLALPLVSSMDFARVIEPWIRDSGIGNSAQLAATEWQGGLCDLKFEREHRAGELCGRRVRFWVELLRWQLALWQH